MADTQPFTTGTKMNYMQALRDKVELRGDGDAHRALAAVLRAAQASFACDRAAWNNAIETARLSAANLPLKAGSHTSVLTHAELLRLKAFIDHLHANIVDRAGSEEAKAEAKLRDIAAFDVLILAQSLSIGERTIYGPTHTPEDVCVRLHNARQRVVQSDLLQV